MVRQEPLRAEERPASDRRGQRLRVQLAAVPERVRDSVYRSKSGRGRPLVGRGGRDLREQRRPARRVRHQRARPRRHPSESAHRTHCHPEQSVRRRRRPVGRRPPVSASRRASTRHASITTRRFRATRCSSAAITHRTPASSSKTTLRFTTATASSGLERHRPPFARSLFPWRAGPQEPDRRRPTRAVPLWQFLSGVRRTGRLRLSARRQLPPRRVELVPARRPGRARTRRRSRRDLPGSPPFLKPRPANLTKSR